MLRIVLSVTELAISHDGQRRLNDVEHELSFLAREVWRRTCDDSNLPALVGLAVGRNAIHLIREVITGLATCAELTHVLAVQRAHGVVVDLDVVPREGIRPV